MQPVEFEAVPHNGMLSVPACYSNWEGRRVKVILQPIDEQPATGPVRSSWRERMTLTPVLRMEPEALLKPVAEEWEAFL